MNPTVGITRFDRLMNRIYKKQFTVMGYQNSKLEKPARQKKLITVQTNCLYIYILFEQCMFVDLTKLPLVGCSCIA